MGERRDERGNGGTNVERDGRDNRVNKGTKEGVHERNVERSEVPKEEMTK